ncbi:MULTISPECIES: helix-turn-helix transcriptional regulator [Streptomyces]|uniref:Helix-turn-helix transcriptional regulator n=1 Tax=Streptomyces fuscus TaxID=3048495 RepID=A0ABT7JDF3_9ACTN|nr:MULTISPECIES: helix-turn-helix transcriptional regulator [Streptomyces]MCM1970686.1 helix-turn-helix transcriptional regulator [Streptomyces sp. G1]MDL2081553.1 helix-turn-helix transcriptional regulator [Streptomyces fuscus]
MSDTNGTSGLFIVIGKQLKILRERKGLTQKEFGALVNYGPDAISAMERGVRTPQPDLLEKAEELLDAGGLLREVVPEVREEMSKARTRHPEWYRNYAGMEAEAVELHHYCNHAVHGLLQTEDYARAVFAKRRPFLDEETIEKRVADRLSRQLLFERRPAPIVSYVLEEVVLDRPIGGRRVHMNQLRRLLHVGQMQNIEIQVMPTATEEHPNLDSAFNLLTPKGHGQVAYTEAQGHPRLILDPEEVRKIADRYGIMRAMALSPAETRKLIESKLEEL